MERAINKMARNRFFESRQKMVGIGLVLFKTRHGSLRIG